MFPGIRLIKRGHRASQNAESRFLCQRLHPQHGFLKPAHLPRVNRMLLYYEEQETLWDKRDGYPADRETQILETAGTDAREENKPDTTPAGYLTDPFSKNMFYPFSSQQAGLLMSF